MLDQFARVLPCILPGRVRVVLAKCNINIDGGMNGKEIESEVLSC